MAERIADGAGGTLVDIDAVAERLGVRVRHIRRLVAERRLPHYKVGGLLRFDLAEIEEWLASRRVDAAS